MKDEKYLDSVAVAGERRLATKLVQVLPEGFEYGEVFMVFGDKNKNFALRGKIRRSAWMRRTDPKGPSRLVASGGLAVEILRYEGDSLIPEEFFFRIRPGWTREGATEQIEKFIRYCLFWAKIRRRC